MPSKHRPCARRGLQLRRRHMVRAGERFPGWGFEDHFGYSTAAHREAIQAQGVCELHRMSFQSTAYQQLAL